MALLALSVVTAAVRSPLLHSAQAQQRNCVLRMAVEESSSLTVTSMPKTTPSETSAPTALEEQLREHASDPDDLRKT